MKQAETITVRQAAKMMRKNPGYVSKGLQQKRFDFGSAVEIGNGQWSYNIIKAKFLEYLGQEEKANT